MSLAEFIHAHHSVIIEEWVTFAQTMFPWAKGVNQIDLRDHADELLTAIVIDMKSAQSSLEKSDKSKGNALRGQLAGVGEKHATQRLEMGLSLCQTMSEYRALRASILRLWEESQGDKQGEVTRFNEAIDEALNTSMARYSETVNDTREQFLAILGHDLRNPIAAINMGATLLMTLPSGNSSGIAARIVTSAERMNRMVNDLLDLTRTRLGSGIPVMRKPMELESVCRQVISEFQFVHPKRQFRFEAKGDLQGEWDSDRLAQVVSNLVANALQHGVSDQPVTIVAQSGAEEILLKVHNEGPPIPKSAMKSTFAPMVRHSSAGQSGGRNANGLRLGLYIASEIVKAHAGTIAVTSSVQRGTTFTVKMPRHPVSEKTLAE